MDSDDRSPERDSPLIPNNRNNNNGENGRVDFFQSLQNSSYPRQNYLWGSDNDLANSNRMFYFKESY